MSKLQERARKLEAEIDRYRKLHAEHKHLVDGAKEEANEHATFRKLQSQLNQTKLLLNTVQEQRKLLNDDNANLRRELDNIYTARRRSIIEDGMAWDAST